MLFQLLRTRKYPETIRKKGTTTRASTWPSQKSHPALTLDSGPVWLHIIRKTAASRKRSRAGRSGRAFMTPPPTW